jgi:uncharacterized membrane protein YbhN (UPF0104 family)
MSSGQRQMRRRPSLRAQLGRARTQVNGAAMPDELSPRHLKTRLLELAALAAVAVAVVLAAPGLGSLRARLRHASPGWLALGVALELGSTLSYVMVFRAVFCPRMSWRTSYQIGMAEQAANSLLPAGGAGGLALGAWALRRGGLPADHIARRTVAFFLLTSLANVGTLILFAAAFAAGLLGNDPRPAVTFGFGGAGLAAVIITLALPALTARLSNQRPATTTRSGRLRLIGRRVLATIGDGVRDGVWLLRTRQSGVLLGSFGYMAFDIAVLWAAYRALGHSPSFGVIVIAYIIGQLGGLLPIPGGIGGTEGGLIGVFVLYNAPVATTTVAVLAYRAIQLWLPALLGSAAFVQLRKTLRREAQPGVMCQPLAEQIETTPLSRSAATA